MPCITLALMNAGIGSKTFPLYRALERTDMAFQLTNIASALERAEEAITEAGRTLEHCRAQVRLARPASNEPLPGRTTLERYRCATN